MTNDEIAGVFSEIATALELDGANPFRIRAYHEAARLIESHPEPMASLAATEGRLEGIRGIGKDLAQKIRDVVAGGSTPLHAEVLAKYPREVLALTRIPGLGPKRVKVLFEQLGVRSRADLAGAARAGKVRALPKFGETVEQKILAAIAAIADADPGKRLLLAGAWKMAHELAAHVRRVRGVGQVEIAGSFRRRRETVGDLDLLAAGGDSERVMEAFTTHPYVAEVTGRGDTKSSVRLASGLQVDLRLVPVESFGAALLYFTGSKAHNIALRRIAIENGWSLNEYGLTRGEQVIASRTEEDVYRALGLAWIPPELREASGEIELAARGELPRLIEMTDLRADLHMHTDRSDGTESLETMVRAARERGYEYVAITEHSQALGMTMGFDAARVRRSVDDIARVRIQVPGIEVLHGLEVDILADGSLDLDDASLALLDWVVVSLHSRLDQPADAMTERVLKGISHPAVHAMGHPTGRRISVRPPAAFDVERVFARAAERGVAMEINSQPDRLDLSDTHARLALARGVPIVIDTDAHSLRDLEFIEFGVFVARRAGLGPQHVLNTRPFAEFDAWRRTRPGADPGHAAAPAVAAPAVRARKVAAPSRRGAATRTASPDPAPKRRTPRA